MTQRTSRGIGYFKAHVDTAVYDGGFELGKGLGKGLQDSFLGIKPSLYRYCGEPKIDVEALSYCLSRLPEGYQNFDRIRIVSGEDDVSGMVLVRSPARRRASYVSPNGELVIFPRGGKVDLYDLLSMMITVDAEREKISKMARRKNTWSRLKESLDHDPEEQARALADFTDSSYEVVQTASGNLKGALQERLAEIVYQLGEKDYSSSRLHVNISQNFREASTSRIPNKWSSNIKKVVKDKGWYGRPIIVMSANMFSPLNVLSPYPRSETDIELETIRDLGIYPFYSKLKRHLENKSNNEAFSKANSRIMTKIPDPCNTGVDCQLFDLTEIDWDKTDPFVSPDQSFLRSEKPLLLVMDYPFGSEQSFLLLLYLTLHFEKHYTGFGAIGKAGTFTGEPGCIMIPNYFMKEGYIAGTCETNNIVDGDDGLLRYLNLRIEKGGSIEDAPIPLITLDGTFLGNNPLYEYFMDKIKAPGGEMEGHGFAMANQTAILRNRVNPKLPRGYIYYASDNPLKASEGVSIAQGSLEEEKGINATFGSTIALLNYLLNP